MTIELPEDHPIKILNADDIFQIMVKILLREDKIDRDKEHFWVVGLATNNKLLFIELISLGTVNSTLVEPMEVFSVALQKRAVNIILVHNHPSGELKPSEQDKDITDRLIQVGKIVNTPVFDHLIITRTSFLSFKDVELLDKLEMSTKYVPPYVQMERMKKELTELAKSSEKTVIAKELKRNGLANELIAESTGLSLEEVVNLKVRRKPST